MIKYKLSIIHTRNISPIHIIAWNSSEITNQTRISSRDRASRFAQPARITKLEREIARENGKNKLVGEKRKVYPGQGSEEEREKFAARDRS